VRHDYTAKIAKGDPRNPMSEAEVAGKFFSNAKTVLSDERASSLSKTVNALENVGSMRQVANLMVRA